MGTNRQFSLIVNFIQDLVFWGHNLISWFSTIVNEFCFMIYWGSKFAGEGNTQFKWVVSHHKNKLFFSMQEVFYERTNLELSAIVNLLVDIVAHPLWRKTVDHMTYHVTFIPGRACCRPVSCTWTSPRLTAWLSALYCSHSCYKGQGHLRKRRSSKVIFRWLRGWWVRCLKMWSVLFWRDIKRMLEVKHNVRWMYTIYIIL